MLLRSYVIWFCCTNHITGKFKFINLYSTWIVYKNQNSTNQLIFNGDGHLCERNAAHSSRMLVVLAYPENNNLAKIILLLCLLFLERMDLSFTHQIDIDFWMT